jgi:hypothetical protein
MYRTGREMAVMRKAAGKVMSFEAREGKDWTTFKNTYTRPGSWFHIYNIFPPEDGRKTETCSGY